MKRKKKLDPTPEPTIMAPAPRVHTGKTNPCRTLEQLDNANQVPSFENAVRLHEDKEDA